MALNETVASSETDAHDQRIDVREQQLFQSLDLDNDQHVKRSDLERTLVENGLRVDDNRFVASLRLLKDQEKAITDRTGTPAEEGSIGKADFCRAIRPNIQLIERVLQGQLVVPDFAGFCQEIQQLYNITRTNRGGHVATYIPQLALQEPEANQYGISLCTVDGQRYGIGDDRAFFSLQSTSKPINYCLALEEHGAKVVHSHIGHEPSGVSFNELTLNKNNQPHNPMINAGAIMSSALVYLTNRELMMQETVDELTLRGWTGMRFDHVISQWQALCGGEKPRFNTSVYLSERQTADRNYALAYFMREKGTFPRNVELEDVLDFYFQCCSIEMNATMTSVVAATLANGGICPISGERIFQTETVRSCLSLMLSCGMYDYSGEFAFRVGLPAKSGVSGAIVIVIPNVMGICVWSPRLDDQGNSVRGIEFCQRLVEQFNFHNYDTLTGVSGKKDPRFDPLMQETLQINELIRAASKGDLGAMQHQLQRGATLTCADYDGRTPLHLAAAEGQTHIVQFLIEHEDFAPNGINPRDRWGGTPLDDAYIQGNQGVAEQLEKAGGKRGNPQQQVLDELPEPLTKPADHVKADTLIWAASRSDFKTICRLVAQGVPLDSADYDWRTPLHLAAAEGHHEVVRYLISHGVAPNPRDRWGNTPLSEAERHNRQAVMELLENAGGEK